MSGTILPRWQPGSGAADKRRATCVLIATHNGSRSITRTIASVGDQCPVFVVSDGSTDDTAAVARAAGARVYELKRNAGKPAAIHRALRYFKITRRYKTVVVLDDDTQIAPDYISQSLQAMTSGVAIVVGKTNSDWNKEVRWNPWVATRAFAYWKYQLFVRRGQSVINALTCISGSNSMFRSNILAQLALLNTPYIVDDTYWTLETHRRKLGRIKYAPRAEAWVQDPTNVKDWYKQNLRWLWGTMQGIVGHKVGRKLTGFDISYLGMIFDWICYVVIWPVLLVFTIMHSQMSIAHILVAYLFGYFVWSCIGAVALRKPQLIVLFPALVVLDWIQRANFIHAVIKTARQPTVDSCRWSSPVRYQEKDAA